MAEERRGGGQLPRNRFFIVFERGTMSKAYVGHDGLLRRFSDEGRLRRFPTATAAQAFINTSIPRDSDLFDVVEEVGRGRYQTPVKGR
jgi:hypothetical protein